MPAGPMNQPYQPAEQTPTQPGVGLPVPGNQVTTKPRQMPSGGSPGGAPGDAPVSQGFGDGPEAASVENAQPEMPNIRGTGTKHTAYVMSDVMSSILEENPGLGSHQAYLLAKRTVEEYDLTKAAVEVWHPLDYGNRGNIPDGPLLSGVEKGVRKKDHEDKRERAQGGVPGNSPSRHQPTVQEQHAKVLLVPNRDAPDGWQQKVIPPRTVAAQ